MLTDLGPVRAINRWLLITIAAVSVVAPAGVGVILHLAQSASSIASGERILALLPVCMALPPVVVGIATVLSYLKLKAIIAAARKHDGLLCRRCMYPTPADATRCSECGLVQDMERTAAQWREFSRLRRRPRGESS